MLSGATFNAAAIVGTAVLRIVVSSDSMKKATAISHGSSRLLESASVGGGEGFVACLCGLTSVEICSIGPGFIKLQDHARHGPRFAIAVNEAPHHALKPRNVYKYHLPTCFRKLAALFAVIFWDPTVPRAFRRFFMKHAPGFLALVNEV